MMIEYIDVLTWQIVWPSFANMSGGTEDDITDTETRLFKYVSFALLFPDLIMLILAKMSRWICNASMQRATFKQMTGIELPEGLGTGLLNKNNESGEP